jgi:3-methyl-2-oxobutanoate hydroxymethyltransferase
MNALQACLEWHAFQLFLHGQRRRFVPSWKNATRQNRQRNDTMAISTVAELLATKGKRQLVLTTAFDAWTAKAAEEAGVDMIVAWGENLEHSKWVIDAVRKGAPNTLIGSGLPSIGAYSSAEEALRLAGELRSAGNDIVYCSGLVPDKFAALSRQNYPCCGHVGYLPVNNTWYGGPRAVGKTCEEALKVYDTTMALEEAGCIAVEMEVVPAKVAARIAKQTSMLVFSMGSGPDCDGQFIFSSDILGTNTDHYPRHSITYASLFKTAVDALSQYREDVVSGSYPSSAHTISMNDEEYEKFTASLEKRP